MKKSLFFTLVTALLITLAACGTTPTEVPTQAPTPEVTAPPAATYALVVTVTDQSGNPITWANGTIQGTDGELPKSADDMGKLTWDGLSEQGGTITIAAQGYVSDQQTLALSSAANELTVSLERDPKQLNPADVCKTGEKMLFAEDFEDNQYQDISNLESAVWSIVNVDGRGFVLSGKTAGDSTNATIETVWGNGIWQFEMLTTGPVNMEFNFHYDNAAEGATAGTYRYFVTYETDKVFDLGYQIPTDSKILANGTTLKFEDGVWHKYTIAYYDGEISVYLDGNKEISYTHSVPIAKGEFGFQIKNSTTGEIQFDNMIVCSLNAPYAP